MSTWRLLSANEIDRLTVPQMLAYKSWLQNMENNQRKEIEHKKKKLESIWKKKEKFQKKKEELKLDAIKRFLASHVTTT